ncbi:carboxypeptidase-like regulatory domain-containing protein [Sphingobacterium sp. E70]|uniref:carboxypeptidase-like regulatory domain-containing protein n=1 Tax=Sphingobacterium sp. E70 TaxID=2853439 RepID=UPI00211CBC11|nr:carboxypeptidase-like regulatory domain-containing protein [Sphingobacterium sp. E70]ULT22786.1 carboxypeptidase-like regulatory domain-containing protein [Sphingobacterium sp. E70]
MSMLLSIGGYAGQQYEVKGKVTDATSKLALSGVVVTNVQTNERKSTDRDGNYQIQVTTGKTTLEFSYLGYITQRVEVKGKGKVDIAMVQDNRTLDEVVVMSYGKVAKRNTANMMTASTALAGQTQGLYIRGGYIPDQNQESYQKSRKTSLSIQ